AHDGSNGDRTQEQKKKQLGRLQRNVKTLDQVERVIAADAGDVDLLGEDERKQDRNRPDHLKARKIGWAVTLGARFHARDAVLLVPDPDIEQDNDANKRHQREPGDRALAEIEHDSS